MPNSCPNSVARPIADFKPSPWGDQFLHYTHTKVIETQQELAEELKEELQIVINEQKPLIQQLCLIDTIERLGVAYHFEKEILDALDRIHTIITFTKVSAPTPNQIGDDLYFTSLSFRLLRQHGFQVSCDVFKGFTTSCGNWLDEVAVASDVGGMLSLYEACHVRVHGEDILDEALVFTTNKLNNFIKINQLNDTLLVLKGQVTHALEKGLHKRLTRLDSVHYMQLYEEDPTHNKTLLRFAKVDFNLLQSSHKIELTHLARWWKQLGITTKLPLRDRIVECYFWAVGVHHEPQFSIGRKIFAMSAQIMTSIDDLYDAYGTLHELQIFTQAVQRWNKSCLDELPKDYRWFYETLILEAFEEMECDLAAQGRSLYVNYAREEIKALCETYLVEASWRQRKYIPTFDEYMQIAVRNTGFVAQILFTFLDMDVATDVAFQWLRSVPEPVNAVCLLLRIHNDIASLEIDKSRGQSPLITASYMRQYDVSYEQACQDLLQKSVELWKDLNQAMILPTAVPMSLFNCILDLARLIDYTYNGGVDAYTTVNKGMMEDITSLFINPISI